MAKSSAKAKHSPASKRREKSALSLQTLIADLNNPSEFLSHIYSKDLTSDQKNLVRAGFIAWLIGSENGRDILDAMLVRAATLISARQAAITQNMKNPIEASKLLLADEKNQWILEEGFYKLGGLKRLLWVKSRKAWNARIKSQIVKFDACLPLLLILHYFGEKLEKDGDLKKLSAPSKERAIKALLSCRDAATVADAHVNAKKMILENMGDPLLGRRHRDTYWAQFKPRLAFFYAAYCIKIDGTKTFLQSLSDGGFAKSLNSNDLKTIICSARYYHELIFDRMVSADDWLAVFPKDAKAKNFIPSVDLEVFKPEITNAFKNTKVAQTSSENNRF